MIINNIVVSFSLVPHSHFYEEFTTNLVSPGPEFFSD